MKKVVFVMLALVVCSSMLFVSCEKKDAGMKIGVSLPTLREERWTEDYNGFMIAAERAGIQVLIQVADNNAGRQLSQCENLITQGVKALIVAPHDAEAAKGIVDIAKKAGIPLISYDRLIDDERIDLYVTFDQYMIGKHMGDYMAENLESGNIVFLKGDPLDTTCVPLAQGAKDGIKAKLDSGAYKIVMEQDVIDWEPANALKHMENALTANSDNIQGVIAPNDGTAGAIVQALQARGLAGKVIVTGQDCETDALQRIAAGTQSMTVAFNCPEMSKGALEAAILLINKQSIPHAEKFTFEEANVLTLGFDVFRVTKANVGEYLK